MKKNDSQSRTSKRKRAVFFPAVLVFIFLSVTGSKPPQQTGPPEKITITYPTAMLSILPYIALEKGYFSAEGLKVATQLHEFGKVALHHSPLVFRNPCLRAMHRQAPSEINNPMREMYENLI